MKNNKEILNNIDLIDDLIKNTKLKIKDVSESIKIDPVTLSRWINKKRFPRRVYHSKIAEIADFYKKIKVDKKL